MKVEQIYAIMNSVTKEILGETAVLAEDLSNVVDIGTEIFNATSVENYTRKLVDRIGKVVFVNRVYRGSTPSVLMDAWQWGSVLEKIDAEMPLATENESWGLEDGETYEQDTFTAPKVSAKFFNSKVTFEIPMSFTELQVKSALGSLTELNSFLSMIENAIQRSMTVKTDALISRTINNMIAQTVLAEFPDGDVGGYSSDTGMKAVNLLYMYNEKFGTTLKADEAITTPEFIRYATMMMAMWKDRMSKLSTLFNVGGKARFTDSEHLHFVLLSDFKNASDVYLQSDTFHKEMVALPKAEIVPYWQGSGLLYEFADVSAIDVKTKTADGVTKEIKFDGIVGVMFDRDALGVTNADRRVTTHYNAKGEFYNNWYKADASYFNDTNENFVVFYVA